MAKVAEGVYQLLTPFPQYSLEEAKFLRVDLEANPRIIKGLPYVMPYLLVSRGENVLIDCGWNTDEAYGALEEAMAEAGTHPSEIQKLLITHVHADHYGMSGRLKEMADCTVVVHEKDADVVRDRYLNPEKLAAQQAQFLDLHGMPPSEAPIQGHSPAPGRDRPVWPATPDQLVAGGEFISLGDFNLQVIWTPGHSPGHICFYEPDRKILFTGDHILPTITPNVSLHIQSHGSPLADYSRSLDVVNALDVEHVFPAHEFNVKDLKVRVAEIHDHHEKRLEEMYRCVEPGGSTAYEVASRVEWATGKMATFDTFLQRAATGETLAHLEYLFEDGRLAKVKRGNQLYWLPV